METSILENGKTILNKGMENLLVPNQDKSTKDFSNRIIKKGRVFATFQIIKNFKEIFQMASNMGTVVYMIAKVEFF